LLLVLGIAHLYTKVGFQNCCFSAFFFCIEKEKEKKRENKKKRKENKEKK